MQSCSLVLKAIFPKGMDRVGELLLLYQSSLKLLQIYRDIDIFARDIMKIYGKWKPLGEINSI
jgi:hypothetical protein